MVESRVAIFRLWDESSSGGVAYAQDKNTSVRVCAKTVGGGLFVGHYGIYVCGRNSAHDQSVKLTPWL